MRYAERRIETTTWLHWPAVFSLNVVLLWPSCTYLWGVTKSICGAELILSLPRQELSVRCSWQWLYFCISLSQEVCVSAQVSCMEGVLFVDCDARSLLTFLPTLVVCCTPHRTARFSTKCLLCLCCQVSYDFLLTEGLPLMQVILGWCEGDCPFPHWTRLQGCKW